MTLADMTELSHLQLCNMLFFCMLLLNNMAALVKGNRGGVVLLLDNFRYQRNKTVGNITYWRCWHKECRAPLKTSMFLDFERVPKIISVDNNAHNHPPDSQLIKTDSFRNKVVEAVKTDPSRPIKRTYDEAIAQYGLAELTQQFHTIEIALKRAR